MESIDLLYCIDLSAMRYLDRIPASAYQDYFYSVLHEKIIMINCIICTFNKYWFLD